MSNASIHTECIHRGRQTYLIAAIDILCDYFEVVIHQFLYFTGYYDHCINYSYFAHELVYFERRTKYGVIVYMNRVPDVIIYVKNLIQSIQPWIVRVCEFLTINY